ncbi:MAG: hypothetical protein IT374_14475 [Polyangiaceae bacterium]|nr:hypothetical protein [Polyangiaceae bacterium]
MHLTRRGAAVALALALVACGARSGLHEGGDPPELLSRDGVRGRSECVTDRDCDADACHGVRCDLGVCLPPRPVVCDDHDPCTADACDPATGACRATRLALDLDRDGVPGPIAGKKPGEPGSCGDDCDDASARAFPGNVELCDGVDNDCNGVVDDEARFVPAPGEAPRLVSDPSLALASAGGLAFGDTSTGYISAYSAQLALGDTKLVVRELSATGGADGPPVAINETAGDAFGGPVVWTGDRYGVAWSDRRDGNYEIYFNTLAPDGHKTGPDVRVTSAPDFSLSPTLVWNGSTFHLVWQDRRSGSFELYGRQLSLDGALLGDEVVLPSAGGAESPWLAGSSSGLALIDRIGDSQDSAIELRRLGAGFVQEGPTLLLADHGRFEAPYVVKNGERYVALWVQKDPHRVFGAVLGPSGALEVPATELSPPGTQSRGPIALPLGDRLVLLYSRQSADGYELYSQPLTGALVADGAEAQLTSSPGDDFAAAMTFGAAGDVGVLFNGRLPDAGGGLKSAVYFSRLVCAAGK